MRLCKLGCILYWIGISWIIWFDIFGIVFLLWLNLNVLLVLVFVLLVCR